uniref:Uncharacterized protein n=1 Tax=Romanomermis culicivorax TaxID=13658 RepID=A0A915IJ30_ROMCU
MKQTVLYIELQELVDRKWWEIRLPFCENVLWRVLSKNVGVPIEHINRQIDNRRKFHQNIAFFQFTFAESRRTRHEK